jgi:hypothetical protein
MPDNSASISASLTCTLHEAVALLAGMPFEIASRYGSEPGSKISGRNRRALDLLRPSLRQLPGTEGLKVDFTKWDPKRNRWQEEERRWAIAGLQWDPKRNKWQEEEERRREIAEWQFKWQEEEERRRGIARLQWDRKHTEWQAEEERSWETARLRLRDAVHQNDVCVYGPVGQVKTDFWMYHSFDAEAHLFRYARADLEKMIDRERSKADEAAKIRTIQLYIYSCLKKGHYPVPEKGRYVDGCNVVLKREHGYVNRDWLRDRFLKLMKDLGKNNTKRKSDIPDLLKAAERLWSDVLGLRAT